MFELQNKDQNEKKNGYGKYSIKPPPLFTFILKIKYLVNVQLHTCIGLHHFLDILVYISLTSKKVEGQ